MSDFTDPDDSEFESRSPTVSFPDHYLVPYIERCKRSKVITCGCSIFFIGLAIFCFFATNYLINYPVTEARKIAFVFGGVFCLVAAASCLNLRFRIIQACRDDPNDNVLFEITERGFELSDSFSGHLAIHETSFCHGTPSEEPSQTETPEDLISRARTIDDPCFVANPRIQQNGHAPPRKSISDGITPDTPLLPQRSLSKLSRVSIVKKGIHSKGIDNNKFPTNYSTFGNGCGASNTEPLVAESMFQNGCDKLEIEPSLSEAMLHNGCDTSETEPLLSKKS